MDVFGDGLGKIKVLAILGSDPDISGSVVDNDGGGLHQAGVDAHLCKDQAYGKNHARQGHQ